MKPRSAAILLVSAAVFTTPSLAPAAAAAKAGAKQPVADAPADKPAPAAAKPADKADKPADKTDKPKDAGNAPVARVNGVPIPGDRVAKEVEAEQARRAAAGAPAEAREPQAIRDWILERFITTEVVWQAAKQTKTVPTEEEFKAEMDKVRGRFPSSAEFDKALKEEGMTDKDLQEEVRRSMAVKNWLRKNVEDTVAVSDADVKAYFDGNPDQFKKPETVHVWHIAVRSNRDDMPGERTKAKDKAETALARLKKGDDFATVARELSEDQGSAKDGGDLGVYARGQGAPPEFEAAAFSLKKDELSGVIETSFGYHVMKVTEKNPAGVFTFDEVKSSVKEHLTAKAREEKAKQLVDDLKKKAKIEKL